MWHNKLPTPIHRTKNINHINSQYFWNKQLGLLLM